jgi:hypothetical protein
MTERKPAGVTFESWVERQVREARERGSFDDLPGTGRPLPPSASDDMAWIREKAGGRTCPSPPCCLLRWPSPRRSRTCPAASPASGQRSGCGRS